MRFLNGLRLTVLFCLLLSACSEVKPRPTETQILPNDYAKCRSDFSTCIKGKFIKFEGVITKISEGSRQQEVRIATQMHGFDVQLIESVPLDLIKSTVVFSGYLTSLNFINDDVDRGRIDLVLINGVDKRAEREKQAAEKKVEAERLEAKRSAEEQGMETEIQPGEYEMCKRDFRVCKGKFIKFEGVLVDIRRSREVRIKAPMHGFDVSMLEDVDRSLIGSKVLFLAV